MNAPLPADQRLLLDDVLSRLAKVEDSPGLLRFMAGMLKTLLRRQGDAQFLATIQDAFAAGLPGLDFTGQKELAAEVLQVVITKRPEIALAWQKIHGAPPRPAPVQAPVPEPAAPPHRRAADLPMEMPPPLPPEADDYAFAEAEAFIATQMGEALDKRLALMRVPLPAIPSVAWCLDQPFFLFVPQFAAIAKAFITGPILRRCRDGLEKRVLSRVDYEILTKPDRQAAFWGDVRELVLKAVDESLTKLATHLKTAEAKQAAIARTGNEGKEGFKLVNKAVTKPRNYNILGVEFALGQVTTTEQVKVKVPPPYKLEPNEIEAQELMGKFRTGAAHAGVKLPDSADFQFLRTLLNFNTRLFIQSRDELIGLAAHEDTTAGFLSERLRAADKSFTNYLTDVLVMMMFTRCGDTSFRLAQFHAVCVGSARDKSAMVAMRPFIPAELARRPHELAVQVREALRRRLHLDAVLGSVERLLDCYKVMGRNLFGHELEEARAVIAAFPMVFAADGEVAAYSTIAKLILATISGEQPDRSICLMRVGQAYDRIGRKAAATA
ncbi:hypothetical protein CCC_00991 [Paramagnetospirillum magnetotacticum MS-1]|uniref:Uncharacterized protein n=1 Tax=Paramagnetospirillum magnetotacticum MS-1 TaxID=272627 RepID=A0A0C2YT94_PARME|nr:hypothetical protein [Paramagnetospirillum magnetotacticum]KIL97930.1 hypothetical protein CCC_00991 [Paramagnetospirillum magnetotacticum MS-1]